MWTCNREKWWLSAYDLPTPWRLWIWVLLVVSDLDHTMHAVIAVLGCRCLGDWSTHTSCNGYSQAQESNASLGLSQDIDRFKFFMERFQHHEDGQKNAASDWKVLVNQKADVVKLALGFNDADLKFMDSAINVVSDCRRCLKWTYAYAYLLKDARKSEMIVPLQVS